MLNAIIQRMFARRRANAEQAPASLVYGAIVAQARQREFYADLGVPDTPTGRFEMIVAHCVPVFRRLKGRQDLVDAGQAVFDLFFADMDRSLRELGVGDLSVPKQIKKMGQAFYGHAGAYTEALDANDMERLADAVAANVYASVKSDQDGNTDIAAHAAVIAGYLARCDAVLAEMDAERVLNGRIDWPAIYAQA